MARDEEQEVQETLVSKVPPQEAYVYNGCLPCYKPHLWTRAPPSEPPVEGGSWDCSFFSGTKNDGKQQ